MILGCRVGHSGCCPLNFLGAFLHLLVLRILFCNFVPTTGFVTLFLFITIVVTPQILSDTDLPLLSFEDLSLSIGFATPELSPAAIFFSPAQLTSVFRQVVLIAVACFKLLMLSDNGISSQLPDLRHSILRPLPISKPRHHRPSIILYPFPAIDHTIPDIETANNWQMEIVVFSP